MQVRWLCQIRVPTSIWRSAWTAASLSRSSGASSRQRGFAWRSIKRGVKLAFLVWRGVHSWLYLPYVLHWLVRWAAMVRSPTSARAGLFAEAALENVQVEVVTRMFDTTVRTTVGVAEIRDVLHARPLLRLPAPADPRARDPASASHGTVGGAAMNGDGGAADPPPGITVFYVAAERASPGFPKLYHDTDVAISITTGQVRLDRAGAARCQCWLTRRAGLGDVAVGLHSVTSQSTRTLCSSCWTSHAASTPPTRM